MSNAKKKKPHGNALPESVRTATLQQIADGMSLRAIKKAGGPSPQQVHHWINTSPDFAERYRHARAVQAGHYAEKIHEVVDDLKETITKKALEVHGEAIPIEGKLLNALVQVARLEVDSLKWTAAKLLPDSWGDNQKVDINATVTHEPAPLLIYSTAEHPNGLDDKSRRALAAKPVIDCDAQEN